MIIDYPSQEQLPQLRRLWQEAFADEDAYLDAFFNHGFAPDRCRCLYLNGQVAAALYWFDCRHRGRPIAYLYAIATQRALQKKGLCRALMTNTHVHLRQLGYAGCLLVPANGKLAKMYETMGYRTCSQIREFNCGPSALPLNLRLIDTRTYVQRRRELLPVDGVVQEAENLEFLQTQAAFYAGDDFVMAARIQGTWLDCVELLGNVNAAPGILRTLNLTGGSFRVPGKYRDFAMYHPLEEGPAPTYFGIPFD